MIILFNLEERKQTHTTKRRQKLLLLCLAAISTELCEPLFIPNGFYLI